MYRILYAGLLLATVLVLAQPGGSPDVNKQVIVITSTAPVDETLQNLHIVRSGTKLHWDREGSTFDIHFLSNQHACPGAQIDPVNPNYYKASYDSKKAYKYWLDCKIVGATKTNLSYEIVDSAPEPSGKSKSKIQRKATPCGGCVMGTDPDAGN